MFSIVNIPQDNEYHRSFNVLVPLEIQGKPCRVVSIGGISRSGRTIAHQVCVEGKGYSIPSWALKENP